MLRANRTRPFTRILAGASVLAALLAAGWIPLAPRADAIRWIVVLVAGGALHLGIWEIARRGEHRWPRGQVALALAAGIGMRLLLLPLSPSLSDDAYRNVWDGRVMAAGFPPYRHAPSAPALAPLRDAAIWPRINHPDYRTIYPPVALAISRAAAALESRIPPAAAPGPHRSQEDPRPPGPGPALASWKLALLAVESLGLWLLAAGLLRRGRGVAILIPAWSPLLIVETYASGHVDGAGVGLLAGAIGLWLLARPAAAACLFVASVLVKWIPAPLAVAGVRLAHRGRLAAASIVTAAGLALPYAGSGNDAVDSLRRYQANWAFNGVLHRALRVDAWAAAPGRVRRGEWSRLLEDGSIGEKRVGRILAVAAVGLLGAILAGRGRRPREVAILVLFLFLLLQPTIHPWYGCWVLPLLAISYRRSILLWTALLPLSYEVLLAWRASGTWVESTPVQLLILLPPLVLFAIESRRGGRSSSVPGASAA